MAFLSPDSDSLLNIQRPLPVPSSSPIRSPLLIPLFISVSSFGLLEVLKFSVRPVPAAIPSDTAGCPQKGRVDESTLIRDTQRVPPAAKKNKRWQDDHLSAVTLYWHVKGSRGVYMKHTTHTLQMICSGSVVASVPCWPPASVSFQAWFLLCVPQTEAQSQNDALRKKDICTVICDGLRPPSCSCYITSPPLSQTLYMVLCPSVQKLSNCSSKFQVSHQSLFLFFICFVCFKCLFFCFISFLCVCVLISFLFGFMFFKFKFKIALLAWL